jgi:hypothetical protein
MICASKPGPGNPLSMGMAGLVADTIAGPMAAGAAPGVIGVSGVAAAGTSSLAIAVSAASARMVVSAGDSSVAVSATVLPVQDGQRYLWISAGRMLLSSYECGRSEPVWQSLAKLIRVLSVEWLAVE